MGESQGVGPFKIGAPWSLVSLGHGCPVAARKRRSRPQANLRLTRHVVQAPLSSVGNVGAEGRGVLRPWPLEGYSVLERKPTRGEASMNAGRGLDELS
jgi:hypothetical protein